MSDLTEIMAAIQALSDRLERVEAKVEASFLLRRDRPTQGMDRQEARQLLRYFTPKQHAVAQMICLGLSDGEMGRRMKVSPNTVKLHVRAIFTKLRVTARVAATGKLALAFDAIDYSEYRALSGGLPRDWAANWTDPDPYYKVYAATKDRT